MKHELKTRGEYFQAIKRGEKTFEVRNNDRDFKVGDTLLLKEWNPKGYNSVAPSELVGEYTGEELEVKVTYILKEPIGVNFGLLGNTVVMSIIRA